MAEQVFICYARQDEDFVLKLAGALKAQGVPVWIDQWDIPGSADWDMAIEEALSKSSHMVVVLSPASMKSGEVRSEWRAALDEGKPVVPVLFQVCTIHRRLRLIQRIDFTSRPPTDATAVGEIVSALGMESRAREKEEHPPAISEVASGGPSSALPVPAARRAPSPERRSVSQLPGSQMICPACGNEFPLGMRFCDNCGAPLGSVPSADLAHSTSGRLLPNTTLQGRYAVMDRIAEGGGTGAIYEVRDLRIPGAVWVLKETDYSVFSLPGDRQGAFEESHRERELLARLDHPNIVKVVDAFDEQGNSYLVMEHFNGRTLHQILDRDGGPLAVDRVLRWAEQICDALGYLNAQNPPIIYRDLKPQTVLELANTNRIKLIDFGIARFYVPGLQSDEIKLGTAGFAPPEQYGTGQTDARSDLYALGATLHYLLTGRDPAASPFQFPPVRSLNSTVPHEVEAAINRALQAQPEERFQTAEEMKRALLRGA